MSEEIGMMPSDFRAQQAKQLPNPMGYYMLCAIPEMEKTFSSGIVKADQTVRNEEILATVLFVIKQGPMAYKDPVKFPTGPWCKEGEFVIVRPNTGTRISIHGKEFRLIADDQVEAVVEDPRGIKRV